MPSTTKVLLAGLMAATTAQAAVTPGSLAAVSGTYAGLTVSISGTSSSQNDNNVGGDSTLAITGSATGYGFGMMLKPSFTISTKACKQLSTSPTVSLDMKMTLPSAFTTAITVANTALKIACSCTTGTGIDTAAMQQKYTISIPFNKLSSFKLSEFAPPNFQAALKLTGSDIVVKVDVADMAVYKAGNAIPLTATMVVGDASKVTLPVGVCANSGKVPCATGSGTICQTMCNGIKAIAATPITASIDFAKEGLAFANKLTGTAKTAALKNFAKCGPKGALTKDCFSIGDTTKGACVQPPPPTTTTTTAAAAKSGASTTVMSAVVAGASLMMALMM